MAEAKKRNTNENSLHFMWWQDSIADGATPVILHWSDNGTIQLTTDPDLEATGANKKIIFECDASSVRQSVLTGLGDRLYLTVGDTIYELQTNPRRINTVGGYVGGTVGWLSLIFMSSEHATYRKKLQRFNAFLASRGIRAYETTASRIAQIIVAVVLVGLIGLFPLALAILFFNP